MRKVKTGYTLPEFIAGLNRLAEACRAASKPQVSKGLSPEEMSKHFIYINPETKGEK